MHYMFNFLLVGDRILPHSTIFVCNFGGNDMISVTITKIDLQFWSEAQMEESGPSRENLSWTEAQMDYLVHLLLEQSRIPGMKSGGGLKAKAYTKIEKNMIERFGTDFTKDKLKNKLKYAKPNLTIMKDILNTSGFGYDPINKCIDVDPEVWSVYIEKYPNRKKYKGPKLWRYYEEFAEVYGDSHATGKDADTCTSMQLDDDIDPFPTTHFSHS